MKSFSSGRLKAAKFVRENMENKFTMKLSRLPISSSGRAQLYLIYEHPLGVSTIFHCSKQRWIVNAKILF
jgi:hypothetical protein